MASTLDKVHSHGMSPNVSTYMTVNSFVGPDNAEITIQPPLRVIFEGEAANVAFSQGGLAARYDEDELRQIGEGSSASGIRRIIGDIAMNGALVDGATKPLHPSLFDGEIVSQPALAGGPLAITS